MKGMVKVLLESEEAPDIALDVCPVILTMAEYNAWEKRSKGKLLCVHDWQPRLALPMGGLEVVHLDHIEVCNFPAGRYCSKCGKVDFSHSERATEGWGFLDFIIP
ncbi:MAG: hypothetical protein M0R06_15770 [Sphaerochaeta sp.]|nr:hypothetical protein [Sphaerochaeta sp.]MDD2731135.1 hypothetical protein [Candidatus Portnoybacteria bacterium]